MAFVVYLFMRLIIVLVINIAIFIFRMATKLLRLVSDKKKTADGRVTGVYIITPAPHTFLHPNTKTEISSQGKI